MPAPTDQLPASPARGGRRRLRSTAVTLALGGALFTVGALGLAPQQAPTVASGPEAPRSTDPAEALRTRVRKLPADPDGWSSLGMAYVQQARSTADAATYNRARTALRKSLALRPAGNFAAETGMGALESARHHFAEALTWARRATAANPYSAPAQGVLADALTQLGRYEDSYAAVQRMTDLRPDSSALARASYCWELRGDTARARELMNKSLQAAGTPAEKAFALTHLATLALETGDPHTALKLAGTGLAALPGDAALLEARARAHTALGHPRQAVTDFTAAVAAAPLPQYLLGLGDLQRSLGHREEAEEQYDVLRAQETLRRASGGAPDADAVLFEADHGNPETAVEMGRAALRQRSFIAVHDAYAWALHRAGRDTEAVEQAGLALALGTVSAPFHYHRALINQALGRTLAARADLRRALDTDPHFHPVDAPRARTALSRIEAAR
ncbi:Tetratricopeptide repeat protein [Streptomyces sp. ADI92-24]|uniref:tetratricopeptide repeat protein n=1 Tax=Streptomyces sp. ADI92-24 TaxID=1522756 RepID=UPI000FAA9E4C|nr:tetratricopeptide repeat protein [Streptomyces sp. ADI92-24]RPK38273.1 Tetratricopeptide repeat protein [Streptomyces sp. ADI92-24]